MAILLAMVMTLGMTMTVSAAEEAGAVTDEYMDNIQITNLAEDVVTSLKVCNIIFLYRDNTQNETWKVVDWADPYIQLDEQTGAYKITDNEGLKNAAELADPYMVAEEPGTSHTFEQLPIGAYVILAADNAGTYGLMVANTYDEDDVYMASKPANVVAKMEGYNTDKTADDKFVHRGEAVKFEVKTKFPAKTSTSGESLTKFFRLESMMG